MEVYFTTYSKNVELARDMINYLAKKEGIIYSESEFREAEKRIIDLLQYMGGKENDQYN